MSAAKQAFYSLSSLLPLSWLTRFSPQRILLPYHHVVSNEPLPHIQNLYAYKGQRQFEKDLDWLLQHFRPLHPQQIRDHIFHEKQLPPHGFLLSFDDGFREVHDVVAPLLERKGVPAIFFINPAFIDNKELFYRCVLSLILEKIKGNAMLRQHLLQQHFPHLDNNEETIRKALLRTQYTSRKMVSEWA